MSQTQSQPVALRLQKSLLALFAALCLVLIPTVSAFADTVRISDPNGVLDASRVQSEGRNLPDPLDVYVISSFTGTQAQLNQRVKSHIDSPRKIVMLIDTGDKYFTVVGGTSVSLSNSQYSSAVSAFKNNYNGNYTNATIGAIQSLESSLGSSGTGLSKGVGGIFSGLLGTLCCVGLIVLVIGGVLFAVGRRIFGFGGRAKSGGYQQTQQQPYNQGYPPNYGPGYNQGQGQGFNPLVAGGLGAAAGGVVGYELGKERGEDESRDRDGGNWGGGNFGGGAGGSFGGGNDGGGDFGGGSSGNFGGGGGGDFGGGGSGGDFGGGGGGGGGDFGGGGGGGDFGGGGSGNF